MISEPGAIRDAIARGEVRRVVVARVARLGDTLHARPTVELVAAGLPGARLRFLVSAPTAAAARGLPAEVVPWDRARLSLSALAGRRAARAALAGEVDLWLGLDEKALGRDLARASGARFFHAASTAGTHLVERKAGVLHPLGLWDGTTAPPSVRWSPLPAEAAAAAARLAALPPLRVGLQVGSHAVAAGLLGPRRRRDPSDAWLLSAARALHERLGAGVVVHGGTGGPERRAARRLAAALAGAPVVLLEGLGVEALGATLAGLSAFVSANTGPLHLAAAAGTPVVLLDGPSTPLAHPWRAPGGARVLSLGLPCSPCRGTAHGRACPAPRCLDDLPAERVVEAVRGLTA